MQKILKNQATNKYKVSSPSLLDCTDTYGRYKGKYKIIRSGPIFEVYEFQYPVLLGIDTSKRRKRIKRKNANRTKEYSTKRATRARNHVRRISLSNFSPEDKFLTLTFSENVEDIEYANNEFRKFIKRLNRRYPNVKYIAVIEFQKRGAIHYHCLINLPYVLQEDLQTLWGNGFIFIQKLNNVDNVGAYISKYMLKDVLDVRLNGKKCYFTSKGLKRPETEYYNLEEYQRVAEYNNLSPSRIAFQNKYSSERNGKVTYTEYNTIRDFNSQEKKS